MEKDKIYGPILRDLLVAANVPKGMIITVIIIIRSSHLHNDEQSAHTVDKCEIYFIVFFQKTQKRYQALRSCMNVIAINQHL